MNAITSAPPNSSPTRFGWAVEGLRVGPDSVFDRDLANLESSAVVPTKGALLPDWVMIIPRTQAVSFVALTESQRAAVWSDAQSVCDRIEAAAGSAVMLEHGSSVIGSEAGCGVDQAHLHIVGLDTRFASWVVDSSEMEWIPAMMSDPWKAIPKGADYLMLVVDDVARYAITPNPTSQFFRRKIAEFIGKAAEWDYRRYQNAENAKRTVRTFSSRCA